jgi:hypothetical protein
LLDVTGIEDESGVVSGIGTPEWTTSSGCGSCPFIHHNGAVFVERDQVKRCLINVKANGRDVRLGSFRSMMS